MVKTGEELASIPAYLLENYSRLGVSDKDVLTIISFLSVRLSGKALWDRVAVIRGYSEVRYLQTAMEKLAEAGLVRLNGYDLDVSPLFNKCRLGSGEFNEPVNLLAGVLVKKDAQHPKKHYYDIFKSIVEPRAPGQSSHVWVQALKPLVDDLGATPKEIERFLEYKTHELLEIGKTRRNGRLPEPLSSYHLRQFAAWRSSGSPEKYGSPGSNLSWMDDLV